MQTPFFAPCRFSGLLAAAGVLALFLPALHGQTPRLIGGPGLSVAVNDPSATSITVGGKPRPLTVVTVVDAPLESTGRADLQWVWLTGSPVARRWQESDRPSPLLGSFDVRWCGPLTKQEFDSIRLIGADGNPLALAGEGMGGAVWLDGAAAGWELLSRAAISIIDAIPTDQREAAFLSLHTATQTPGDHWRAALLRRAIKPATPAPPDFQPAALNTLALQLGDHWAGAIGRLSRVDVALGQQVARRLLHVAFLPTSDSVRGAGGGGGAWAVLWADADPHFLDTLLTTPTVNLATAATSFLAAQPPYVAWVLDDAGLRDAFSTSSLATVSVVSLAEQAMVATVGLPGQPGSGEPVAVKPLVGQSFALSASQAAPRTGTTGAGSWVSFKLGATVVSMPVAAASIPATPPGVLVGPFSLDWTLETFRRQQPVRLGGVAASLLPDDSTPSRWVLYLESRPQGGRDAELERERFRVWVGATGSPVACVDVAPGGNVNQRIGSGVATQASRIPGGWCATLTFPASAIDASGTLRLAVEHTAASGLRSCWPRPMLPWQAEPGRLAIDTAAWDRELKP